MFSTAILTGPEKRNVQSIYWKQRDILALCVIQLVMFLSLVLGVLAIILWGLFAVLVATQLSLANGFRFIVGHLTFRRHGDRKMSKSKVGGFGPATWSATLIASYLTWWDSQKAKQKERRTHVSSSSSSSSSSRPLLHPSS